MNYFITQILFPFFMRKLKRYQKTRKGWQSLWKMYKILNWYSHKAHILYPESQLLRMHFPDLPRMPLTQFPPRAILKRRGFMRFSQMANGTTPTKLATKSTEDTEEREPTGQQE